MTQAHKVAPFFCGPEGFPNTCSYVCLRLRQMAAKVRGLCADGTAWDAVHRKLGQQQLAVFLRLCRCIKPNFNAEADLHVSFKEWDLLPATSFATSLQVIFFSVGAGHWAHFVSLLPRTLAPRTSWMGRRVSWRGLLELRLLQPGMRPHVCESHRRQSI